MDKNFMEFWGNFLLSAAKGQRQLDEMARWIDQGFSGLEDLDDMFRQSYRMDSERPDYPETLKKAEADFRKSFKDYLSLFGVVPRNEHLELLKKHEELKEKVAAQEETIRQLQTLLEGKGVDQEKVITGFEKMIAEQNEQFRELMQSFSKFYKIDKDHT